MTEEDELIAAIFGEQRTETLEESLPYGYTEKGMGRNDEVDAMLGVRVIRTHTNYGDDVPTHPKPWPGPEEHVDRWYELENGKAVGWVSEDPWRFVVRALAE